MTIEEIQRRPGMATVLVIGLIGLVAFADWSIRERRSSANPVQAIFEPQPEPLTDGPHNPLLAELRRLNPHSAHSVTDWDGEF